MADITYIDTPGGGGWGGKCLSCYREAGRASFRRGKPGEALGMEAIYKRLEGGRDS